MIALFLTLLLFLLPVYAGQALPSTTRNDPSHMISPSRSSTRTPDQDDEDDQRQGPFFPGAFPFRRPPTPRPNSPPTPSNSSVTIKTRITSASSSQPELASSPVSPPPTPPEQQQQPPQPQFITSPSPPPHSPFHVELPPPPVFHAPPPSASSIEPQAVTEGMQHHMDTPVLELWDPMDNQAAGALYQYGFVGNNGNPGTLELDMSGGIIADDMYFDDEGLGTLEKIYLFARSRANFHRLFISRSLPNFLPDLTPHEAVEYVLPLLNSLGTDPEESVREAFVSELVPTVWWFYTNCQLVDPSNLPGSDAPQTDTVESRPAVPVEPERDLDQPPAPSTSSDRSSSFQSSNIAVSADGGAEASASSSFRQTLDHGLLHSSLGDGGDVRDSSAQQQQTSSTSAGYALEEQLQSASLTPQSPTAFAAPPSATSAQPTAPASSSPTNEDTTADARPQHAPTDEPPPLLPVQVFTPLFAALLLSPNNTLSDGSRAAVVELLRRLRDGFGLPQPPTGPGPGGTHVDLRQDEREESGIGFPFGRWQRKLLERELIMGLAIGMARMDEEGRNFVVLSTDANGGEDLGLHGLDGEDAIPQVTESDLANDEPGQEEQSLSGGLGEETGAGLGLVSTAPETSDAVHDERGHEDAPQDSSPALFDEESPRVQLPGSTTGEPRAEVGASLTEEAQSSPTIAAIAPPTVTSPSPQPPSSTISPPRSPRLSPRGRPLRLSSTAARSTSPLGSVAPISATAHLTYLSPGHSRSGSPTRQLQSPAGSAPHTPPSPTLRPVRLPSSESTTSFSIPGTPMEVIEHEDVLGLDTEADAMLPSALTDAPSPAATIVGGWLDIPMVPEPVLTPGLGPSFRGLPSLSPRPPTAESRESSPAPFKDSEMSLPRRPSLSPVQPPSDQQTPTAPPPSVPQQPASSRSEPSRTTSYSSEKSESTPTEGSSGETVTPSVTPAVSPTRSRSMEAGRSGSSTALLEEAPNPPSGAAPPDLEFQSVLLEAPTQRSNTVSPTSTDTSPSTGAQTGISVETVSSEASSASAGTMETRSSSSESVPVHTPEGPTDGDDAGLIALQEGMDELEHVRSPGELGIEEAVEQNPFFLAASTASAESETSVKSTDSDTVSAASEKAPSDSPPVQTGSRSMVSVGAGNEGAEGRGFEQETADSAASMQGVEESKELEQDRSEASTVAQAAVEHSIPTSTSSPPLGVSTAEPVAPEGEAKPKRPKMGRNRSGSFSAGSSTPFVVSETFQSSTHLRSKSVGRPDFVALPARGSLDSPYPSPPAQDAYAVPPIDFGTLFAAQLASTAASASAGTFSPPPEPAAPEDIYASPVVRLPPAQANNLSPEFAEDQGNGNGASDVSWFQNDSGGTIEEPAEYDGTHDAAVGRVASMSLVAAITAAGILSDESKSLFAQEVVKVGQDQVYWVRREAAFALGALAKTVSLDLLTSSLLPLYEGMTRDEVANVRQSALFALPGILDRLPSAQRRDLAIKQCAALSHDADRLVRSALLEIMGEMIYCFRNDDGGPPSQLIEVFVGNNEHADDSWVPVQEEHQWGLKAPFAFGGRGHQPSASSPPLRSMFEGYNDPNSSQYQGLFGPQTEAETPLKARDPERVLICAFNFPAVVAAMGPQRWPELRPYYRDLVRDSATKVRKTLGASIGEIARMVGPDNASRDLVSIWWDLMHDENAEARAKVVGCVAAFVKALGPNDRRNIGVQLEGLWETALMGWRDREALAAQFGELSALLNPVGRGGSIKTLLISALTDRTAAVRDAAVSSCPKVMEGLMGDPDVRNTAMRDINALALDTSFRRRATYIAVTQTLLLTGYHRDAFEEPERQDLLATLAEDNVVDVRIGLSRFISLACARYFPDRQARPVWLKSILRRLGRDPSTEVKSFVASLARHPSSIFVPAASSDTTSPVSSPFATFSRPPTLTPLLSESLDDIAQLEDTDSNSPGTSVAAVSAVPEASVAGGTAN